MTTRLPRGTYLGGHDIAAIIGEHPFQSAGESYAKCALGRSDSRPEIYDEVDKPNAMRRGIVCEAGLIDFIEEHILSESRPLVRDLFVCGVPDYFAGTVDAAAVDDDDNVIHIHEMTTTTSRSVGGKDGWGTKPKRYKAVQNLWYQGISGAKGGTIWLFIADTGEIISYPVPHDADAIARFREAGEEFWRGVLARRPPRGPGPGASVETWAAANRGYDAVYRDHGDEPAVDADLEMQQAATQYATARDAERVAKTWKAAAAARIKALLRDRPKAAWPGGRISWTRRRGRERVDYADAFCHLAQVSETDDDLINEIKRIHTKQASGYRQLRVDLRDTTNGV